MLLSLWMRLSLHVAVRTRCWQSECLLSQQSGHKSRLLHLITTAWKLLKCWKDWVTISLMTTWHWMQLDPFRWCWFRMNSEGVNVSTEASLHPPVFSYTYNRRSWDQPACVGSSDNTVIKNVRFCCAHLHRIWNPHCNNPIRPDKDYSIYNRKPD